MKTFVTRASTFVGGAVVKHVAVKLFLHLERFLVYVRDCIPVPDKVVVGRLCVARELRGRPRDF